MNALILVTIVFALSLDAFTALFLNRFLKTAAIRIILINILAVTFVVAVFAVGGAFIGKQFDYLFSGMGTGLASGILLMLGLKMIAKSFKTRFDEMNFELEHPKMVFFFAIALSMNAFIMGLALPAFNVSILQIFSGFFLVYLFLCSVAVIAGRLTDNFRIALRLEFIGGAILGGSAVYFLCKLFKIIS